MSDLMLLSNNILLPNSLKFKGNLQPLNASRRVWQNRQLMLLVISGLYSRISQGFRKATFILDIASTLCIQLNSGWIVRCILESSVPGGWYGMKWYDIAHSYESLFFCLVQTWSFQHFSICCSPHCDLVLQGFGNYEPPPEDWARWECLPTIYGHLWARLQIGVARHFLFE